MVKSLKVPRDGLCPNHILVSTPNMVRMTITKKPNDSNTGEHTKTLKMLEIVFNYSHFVHCMLYPYKEGGSTNALLYTYTTYTIFHQLLPTTHEEALASA